MSCALLIFANCLLVSNLGSVRGLHVCSDFGDMSLASTGEHLLLISEDILTEFSLAFSGVVLGVLKRSWIDTTEKGVIKRTW